MSKVIINRNSSTIVILMLIFLASGTFFGVANAQNLNETSSNNKSLSLNDLFELVENSIVQVIKTMPPADPLGPDKENTTSLGSGFIYNDKGYIVTNNHVVENAKVVDITLINGDRYTANITGTDAFSDLAVIKINENTTDIPKPLVVGNSSELRVGDQVVAVGNPFGLESSMTTGIVSQIGRLLSVDERGFSIPNAIQTDALINPGNSGGPLLNMKGEVIGVNTAGIFPGGIGLAVPSDTVLRIIPVLMEEKNYTHPWLGVTGNTLTADIAKREKVDRTQKGVIIDTIVRSSPADLAGLNGSSINQYGEKRGGDIITALDGKQIIKMEDLISYLELNKAVNDNATLSVYRDGEIIDKQVTLKSRPVAPITNQTQN
ncbi:MAG TPA: trypsin-like peptidase domain-containing protein [Nitrososphaeraceae archaeon]|jgi:S1-C subfamily serine protease|nr:trypsin-like peptidase domain-containing protein [Nitrososphaeraceae archaeon]